MRVDKPEQQNTFNVILIAFFFLGSSNLLYIFFFRTNPIKYGNNLQDAITKYELCEKKYKVVSSQSLQSLTTEELLSVSYAQQEALKIFTISIEQAENYIKKDPRFQTKSKYDRKKFQNYLSQMKKMLNLRIRDQDYLEYIKIHIAYEYLNKLQNQSIKNLNFAGDMSSHLNKQTLVIVEGYRLPIKVDQQASPSFNKKEIKKFIKQQIRNKIHYYIVPESVSGFIIKVNMGLSSIKIIDAIEVFLKQESYDVDNLINYLKYLYTKTENFTKTIDYKKSIDTWKKNILPINKNIDLSSFLEIENLNKVQENPDNAYLFDKKNSYQKAFTQHGSQYYRVIIKNHQKEEEKKLTKEEIDNYVIPEMLVIQHYDKLVEKAYQSAFNHNNKIKKLVFLNGKKISLELPHYIFKDKENVKNQAVVLYDNYKQPYIFIITDIYQNKQRFSLQEKISVKKYLENSVYKFFYVDLYLQLFYIYYSKFKNQFKA